MKFFERQIHIYNIYNLVNVKKISISIPILDQGLDISTYEELIILRDFNLYHMLWKRFIASTTYIKKSEKLLFFIQRREIEQIVFIKVAIYKKFLRKSTIDLIFATLLLLQSFIYSKIIIEFNHDLDYQFIFS